MLWFAVWVVLLLSAALVFFLLGRDLWGKGRALSAELAVATDRLTELGDRLALLEEATSQATLDVRSQGRSPRTQR